MPVLTIASPKGGAGKSTTALTLGATLASEGATVSILDCDPNRPIALWGKGSSRPTLQIIGDIEESEVTRIIDSEKAKRNFVIVDLEGTASRLVSRALSRATLAIIPMRASAVDAAQAARAVKMIRDEEHVLDRAIPYRVLLTCTSPAIPTRAEKAIVAEMTRGGILSFDTHLNERAAYKAQFAYRKTLAELDPLKVNGLPAALDNARRLAGEVVSVLRSLKNQSVAA